MTSSLQEKAKEFIVEVSDHSIDMQNPPAGLSINPEFSPEVEPFTLSEIALDDALHRYRSQH